ncbi:MAG TPA: hypothetical protein VNQ99_17565 [Xanthobacteraceae bacterium]|nr:hypothetical protein [Xanthobacteraceae bacterium]
MKVPNGSLLLWPRGTANLPPGETAAGFNLSSFSGVTNTVSRSTDVPPNSPIRYSAEISVEGDVAGVTETLWRGRIANGAYLLRGKRAVLSFYARGAAGTSFNAGVGSTFATMRMGGGWQRHTVETAVALDATGNLLIAPFQSPSADGLYYIAGIQLDVDDLQPYRPQTEQQEALATWEIYRGVWRRVGGGGSAVSVTGTTTETVVASVIIPANSMGTKGGFRVTHNWSHTNNANAKALRLRASNGGHNLVVANVAAASQARSHLLSQALYRDNIDYLIAGTNAGNATAFGQSTSAQVSGAMSAYLDITLSLTVELADTADTATLESLLVETMLAD